jgi:hypothetical protein
MFVLYIAIYTRIPKWKLKCKTADTYSGSWDLNRKRNSTWNLKVCRAVQKKNMFTFPYLSFETYGIPSSGNMHGQIFHCFCATWRNIWKKGKFIRRFRFYLCKIPIVDLWSQKLRQCNPALETWPQSHACEMMRWVLSMNSTMWFYQNMFLRLQADVLQWLYTDDANKSSSWIS